MLHINQVFYSHVKSSRGDELSSSSIHFTSLHLLLAFSTKNSELTYSTENYHFELHDPIFHNYEPSTVVSHRELLENELQSLL
jgi:hypothetical protein